MIIINERENTIDYSMDMTKEEAMMQCMAAIFSADAKLATRLAIIAIASTGAKVRRIWKEEEGGGNERTGKD